MSIDLTIILPIHNERENIAALLEEIRTVMAATKYSYEVLAIDDGSTDDSADVIRGVIANYPQLKLILFRRNYGQSAAFDAGFRHARGAIIITMDADGQNDPADIPKLVEAIESGYEFVAGRRKHRQDNWLRKIPSRIANKIIRKVMDSELRDLGCSLKAYRREITDELHLYGEMHRFLGVLVGDLGAKMIEVRVNHRPRQRGRSKYGIGRTFKVMLDLVTVWFMRGYQTKPIYVFGGTGLALGFTSVILAAIVLYKKFAQGIYVHLQPLFIVAMIFAVMSVQFLVLGLLAEIMVRTYFESQRKPPYLISKTFGIEDLSSLPLLAKGQG